MLQNKSSGGSIFVDAGFKAVSMLLRVERYFALIVVNVENADSHRCVETNGRSAVTAESDHDGSLMLCQKVYSFFPQNSSRNLSHKIDQQTFREI